MKTRESNINVERMKKVEFLKIYLFFNGKDKITFISERYNFYLINNNLFFIFYFTIN